MLEAVARSRLPSPCTSPRAIPKGPAATERWSLAGRQATQRASIAFPGARQESVACGAAATCWGAPSWRNSLMGGACDCRVSPHPSEQPCRDLLARVARRQGFGIGTSMGAVPVTPPRVARTVNWDVAKVGEITSRLGWDVVKPA